MVGDGEGEPGTATSSSAMSRKASLSASSCLARSLPFLFLDGDDLPVFFGGIASCVLDLNFFFGRAPKSELFRNR